MSISDRELDQRSAEVSEGGRRRQRSRWKERVKRIGNQSYTDAIVFIASLTNEGEKQVLLRPASEYESQASKNRTEDCQKDKETDGIHQLAEIFHVYLLVC